MESVDGPRSATSASSWLDGRSTVSPDDEPLEHKLTAEDLTDDKDLAELREIEKPVRRGEPSDGDVLVSMSVWVKLRI